MILNYFTGYDKINHTASVDLIASKEKTAINCLKTFSARIRLFPELIASVRRQSSIDQTVFTSSVLLRGKWLKYDQLCV